KAQIVDAGLAQSLADTSLDLADMLFDPGSGFRVEVVCASHNDNQASAGNGARIPLRMYDLHPECDGNGESAEPSSPFPSSSSRRKLNLRLIQPENGLVSNRTPV